MKQNVVILGASDKVDRFAFKAFMLLQENGHHVFPVQPALAAAGIQIVNACTLVMLNADQF